MKTLSVKCGIYDTQYRLITHRDGTITVKYPEIIWSNNTGVLKFSRVSFEKGDLANKIKECFADQTMIIPGYECASLADAINGYLT